MKLKKLLKDIPFKSVKGSKDIAITGVCANSKLVAPGHLFIAKKGLADDGSRYIQEAVSAGASAVLTDIYDPSFKNITQIIHPKPVEIEGALAAHYYEHPSKELFMVGLTGTNGKTTTSFVAKYLLDQFRGPCGLIGTIEYIIGHHRYQATRTTPDVSANHKMLRDMISHGSRSAVMEVTSHALDQGRVQYIDYDVAIFTNLTLDHLDYHQTMEQYCLAKNRLFRSLEGPSKGRKKQTAVVNADSGWTSKILEGCRAKVLSYGINSPADLRAADIELTAAGTKLTIHYQGKTYPCQWPLVGRFNVYNCLAAMAAVLCLPAPIEEIIKHMDKIPSVPGRLQPVPNGLGVTVYVDFAHTNDALENVLECLFELKKGKIITVFGCGGDRDQSKRSKMAEAAEQFSDVTIVTSDNPRTEDPLTICRQIIQGFKKKDSCLLEIDRRAAIKKAIDISQPNDIILIAGKGHEPYQIFAHQTIEFSDAKVVSELCEEKSLHDKN
jgi:UDP-N-acetylmuramoyl-L-alanyl-D-glutamate--2,6-diaminopimelate ligase